ncbi:MAG TPA: DUF4838 domain-containing protein [Firmicutes bacterium]|nr:DUF4838 domain-containing protein [Bacillota bacterium]
MLKQRGVLIFPEELCPEWEERMYAAGLNLLGLSGMSPDPFGRSAAEVMEAFLTPENRAVLERLESRGVDVEWEMHSLSCLLPRALFEEHPEWFRVNKEGRRTNDVNLCSSSEEALEEVSRRAAELARLYRPRTNRYHFWMDDIADSACYCPRCGDLSHSDQAMKVYNAIIRGIRRVNPQATQCYLAYHDTIQPPRLVKPEPGIFLEFAPMDRVFDKGIADLSSEKNREQSRHLPELLAVFGTQGSQALDYWLDNSYFSNWTKPPKPFHLQRKTLEADIRYYREMGIESVTTFACYLGEEYTALYPYGGEVEEYGRLLCEESASG